MNYINLDIRSILSEVKKGEIELPDFQRPYVWNGEKVQKYIESIYHGHPSGHYLFWKTDIGKKSYNFLVDGQQRITSLMWAIYGELPKFHRGKKPSYTFFFNPFTEEITRRAPTTDEYRFWINIKDFFNENDLQKYQNLLLNMKDEEIDPAPAVLNLAKLYKILDYSYTIDRLDPNISMMKAVEIFNLINSSGTKLSKGDLAYASLSVIWPDFKNEFEEYTAKLKQDGYTFSVYFYMRLIAVLSDKSALMKEDFHNITKKELELSWSKLKKILNYLLPIYSQYLCLENESDFVTLSPLYLASLHLSYNSRNRFSSEKEISNWMYWTLLAFAHQRYSGSGGDNKIDIDARVIRESVGKKDPLNRLILNIAEQVGSLKIRYTLIKGASAGPRNALSSIYHIMLKINGATDWKTGQEFYPFKRKTPETHIHHIFPKSLDKKIEALNQDINYIDNLPNRAILLGKTNQEFGKTEPASYLPDVKKQFPKSLEQQFIPENKKLYTLEEFNNFINRRSELLAEAIGEFIDSFNNKLDLTDYFDEDQIPDEGVKVELKSSFAVHTNEKNIGKVPEIVLKEEVVKTAAAFANTDGGKIYIGIDDNLKILGIEKDLNKIRAKNQLDGLKKNIVDFLDSKLESEQKFNGFNNEPVVKETSTGKQVIILNIDPVREYPISFKGKIYVRKGSSDYPLTDAEKVPWLKNNRLN